MLGAGGRGGGGGGVDDMDDTRSSGSAPIAQRTHVRTENWTVDGETRGGQALQQIQRVCPLMERETFEVTH